MLSLGWGMLPDQQVDAGRTAGEPGTLGDTRSIAVPLLWQLWKLRSTLLDRVPDTVVAHARTALS